MRTGPSGESIAKLLSIPDGLVVMTLDDGNATNAEFVAPLLKELGFGATFFVGDPPALPADWKKENYMTWDQVRKLHKAGFEVGNHTASHLDVSAISGEAFIRELEVIELRCAEHGMPRPTSFCYPGFNFGRCAVEVLRGKRYRFARRGTFPEFQYDMQGQRGPVYDPRANDPLLIPTTGFSGPHWVFEDLVWAVDQARNGKIAVLCFHGVPDPEHWWVGTDAKVFERYMDYLLRRNCTVIAMRDLARYVDPVTIPNDPLTSMERVTIDSSP